MLAALSLLAGCSANADFGQVRSTYVRDDMHDWLSNEAIAGQPTSPSSFKLTDDERLLRDLAYPLIEPPYDRQQFYSVLGEYGDTLSGPNAAFDRSEYSRRLLSTRYRSPAAQYAKLTDDIRNDITRLPQFFEAAARVIDIDGKRRKSLDYITDIHPKERENALRRIRENASLVAMVQNKLGQRVTGYRFALERLVVMTPSPQAIEVERSLNQMQASVARYRANPGPGWAREQSLASAR